MSNEEQLAKVQEIMVLLNGLKVAEGVNILTATLCSIIAEHLNPYEEAIEFVTKAMKERIPLMKEAPKEKV